jgi:hypothetical protein
MNKNKFCLVITLLILISNHSLKAQLYINSGTTFYIQTGGVVTVQGDIISNSDVTGPGKLQLKGFANQNVNMNGFSVPNLEMDNTANATLTGNASIGSSILFTNGKIQQGNFNVTLTDVATVTGGGTNNFFETNGTGQLLKNVSSNTTNFEMPVGIGSIYLPAFIQTNGTYASASVGVQVKDAVTTAYSKRHPRSTDYTNEYWPITQTGITGTLRVKGKYNATFTGIETDMRGFYHNGTDWTMSNANIDYVQDTAGSLINGNGDLYAMNRFVLTNIRSMLQGATEPLLTGYVAGLMNDRLRSTTFPAPPATTAPTGNLIPLTDPYRDVLQPYIGAFPLFQHQNNSNPEIINASVLNEKASINDNIVDWVFIELRQGTSPGSVVTQTRSALIQRDGDIVDIDGISPVYFKNLDPNSNYSIGVRHRNHLGLYSANAAPANLFSLGLNVSLIDLKNGAISTIRGTANTNYVNTGSVNMLYAGNVNLNGNVRYSNSANDKDDILLILGGNQIGLINNTYHRGDINMNRAVRYSNAQNDKDFLLSTPLSAAQLSSKLPATPN